MDEALDRAKREGPRSCAVADPILTPQTRILAGECQLEKIALITLVILPRGRVSTYHSLTRKIGAPVNNARLLLSVMNEDNDFQIEQVSSARRAATRCGVDLEILCAHDDGILQSQQLLQRIQSAVETRPKAIIFEPAGSTTLPHVARAAGAAGIGWVVLSRDADYIAELRS